MCGYSYWFHTIFHLLNSDCSGKLCSPFSVFTVNHWKWSLWKSVFASGIFPTEPAHYWQIYVMSEKSPTWIKGSVKTCWCVHRLEERKQERCWMEVQTGRLRVWIILVVMTLLLVMEWQIWHLGLVHAEDWLKFLWFTLQVNALNDSPTHHISTLPDWGHAGLYPWPHQHRAM